MALVVKDRIKEVTTTTGTGTLTLAGAVTKFQSFSVIGDGNTTYYAIESGNGTDWEVGVGTYTASGTTLSRDTILESSNGGSAISLLGTSTVFCTYPAERSVNTEDIGVSIQAYDADTTKNDVANTFTANQTINGDLTVDTNTLYVDSTNNRVGIGTSSPSSPLSFVNATGEKITLYSNYSLGVESSEFRLATSGVFAFRTGGYSGTERMRLDSSGNVGIGTSSPESNQRVTIRHTDTNNMVSIGNSLEGLASGTNNAGAIYFGINSSTADSPTAAIESSWGGATTPQIHIGVTRGGNKTRYSALFDSSLRMYTADNERMRITSAGNVGIGTSSPNATLNVNGPAQFAGGGAAFPSSGTGIEIVGASVGGENYIQAYNRTGTSWQNLNITSAQTVFGTSGTERMRITSSGDVGIGTSSLSSLGSVNTPSVGLYASSGARLGIWGNGGRWWYLEAESTNAFGIGFRGAGNTTDNNVLTMNTSGNVGIGTSSSTWKTTIVNGSSPRCLQISQYAINSTQDKYSFISAAHYTAGTYTDGFALIGGVGVSGTNAVQVGGGIGESLAATQIQFYTAANTTTTAGTERMRIDSSGNVLMGCTSVPNVGVAGQYGTSSSSTEVVISKNTSGTTPALYIRTSGGASKTPITFYNDTSQVGSITTTTSSTAYNTSSDYRLKENITPMSGSIDRLKQLKPSTWSWKTDGSHGEGFIAHEAQEVVPEAVSGEKDAVDDEGNPVYQGIDQSKLVPLLTASLQEAITKIEDLEARIAILENK